MNHFCYISGNEIIPEQNIDEHIIQNALGGMLKSNCILSKEWNNGLHSIDADLCNQIPLGSYFDVKRDRGQNPKIPIVINQTEYKLIPGSNIVEHRNLKPKELIEDGIKYVEIHSGKAFEQFKKSFLKKNKDVSEKEFNQRIIDKGPVGDIPYNAVIKSITGIDAFRAIAKIATNYYVHLTNQISEIQSIVPFIRDAANDKFRVSYFNEFDRNEIGIHEDETSHIIHLLGLPKEKILFAYIELFNVHCFVVLLNEDYIGKEITSTYRFDLKKRISIDESLKMLSFDFSAIKSMNSASHFGKGKFDNRVESFMKQLNHFIKVG